MREFRVGDKVKNIIHGEGVVEYLYNNGELEVCFGVSSRRTFRPSGLMVEFEHDSDRTISLIDEEVQEIKEEEVMSKFKIGDKVWHTKSMEIGEVVDIVHSKYSVKVVYNDGSDGFYNQEGQGAYTLDKVMIALIGEDVIIKSPVLPEVKRTFKDIIDDICKCKKEFVVDEENYQIEILHTRDNGIEDIYASSYRFAQSGCQYYTKEVREFIKEIKELDFTESFADWVLGKTMDCDSVAPAPEIAVQPEIPCDDYPKLTGCEEIGTVGYVGGHLVKIMKDPDKVPSGGVCGTLCDLRYKECAKSCEKRHFKLYKG